MDFSVMPVKLSTSCGYAHHLLYKPNSAPRRQDQNTGQNHVIFVTNIPHYCAKKELLAKLFSQFGKVKDVYIHRRPIVNFENDLDDLCNNAEDINHMGFKVAYIRFTSSKALTKATETDFNDPVILRQAIPLLKCGFQDFLDSHLNSLLDENEVLKDVEEYMKEYEKNLAEQDQKARQQGADEDGWVLVTGKSKIASKANGKGRQRKHKKKYLQNFYSFQIKESKMQRIAELRRKFEEDRKIIAEMKMKRKFKPL